MRSTPGSPGFAVLCGHNRIAKRLEDANVKLGSVASDTLGGSGRAILRAFLAGEDRPEWLAGKALSSLRNMRKSNRTRHGNRSLRRALCQSAWSVSHKKNCYLAALVYRRTARAGVKKAVLATAQQILIIAFHIPHDGTTYQERGGDFFDRLNPERARRKLIAWLERLGWDVVLDPHQAKPTGLLPPRRPGRPCKCAERGIPCKQGRL